MNTATLSSEWAKARTVRSTGWSIAAFVVIGVALSVLPAPPVVNRYDSAAEALANGLDPVSLGYSGIYLSMIALVVFSILSVTSEYSTGSVQGSLAAVPRRGVFYASKLVTVSAVVTVLSAATVLVSFLGTQAVIGDLAVSLTDDQVLRALGAGVLYVTLLCLFSMGVAAMLRSAALCIGIIVPMLFMVSNILTALPGVGKPAQFLPDQAGQQMMLRGDVPEDALLTPTTGFLVLLAWTVASVAGGYWAVARRDV
ncbi:ABC transporter permease subunit [Nocardiopsis terrae]